VQNTIVVEYDAAGRGRLAPALPAFLCEGSCPGELYQPAHALAAGPVSPIAAHRYGVRLP
jgi:hypothetical protein